MAEHCQQQARYGQPVPLSHQQQSVPAQLTADHGPSCGSLLGHNQEWADPRPGHGWQRDLKALVLPIMWSQLASQDMRES